MREQKHSSPVDHSAGMGNALEVRSTPPFRLVDLAVSCLPLLSSILSSFLTTFAVPAVFAVIAVLVIGLINHQCIGHRAAGW